MKPINNTNRIYVTRNFSNFDAEENITSIDEAAFDFLKGKGRLYGDVNQAVTAANTLLDTYMGDPDQKAAASSAKAKIEAVKKELGDNPKAHERSKYREFLDSIEKAKSEFKKSQTQLLSKRKEYADVVKIIEEASTMSKETGKKASDVMVEISKKKGEENEKNLKLKDAIKLSKTLKKHELKGKKNEEIHDVQKEFIRKFKGITKMKDSGVYKKIKDAVENKKEGGFFGPTTEKIILGLKAGFGMDDKSSDITQELIDKIYTEKIKESESFRSIKGFKDFDLVNEDFDVNKFLEVVGEPVNKEKTDSDKSAEKWKKEHPDPAKDTLEKIKEIAEESYKKYKEGIDYMLDKDFEPTEYGREQFKNMFNQSWDEFKKLDDDKKKEFLSKQFKDVLSLEAPEPLGKIVVDAYFKSKIE